MKSSVYRVIVGIFSLLFLAAAGFFWLTGGAEDEISLLFFHICCRAGAVLFFVWMMWKYLVKMPAWMLLCLPVILIFAAINLRTLGVTIPLVGVLAVLNGMKKKKKISKKPSK